MFLFWLSLVVTAVRSEDPGTSLCNRKPVSTVIGFPLPKLPNQFHVIFEANILQKSYTVYQEEYYDYVDNRGVIITTRNGRSMKAITDFTTYSVHQLYLSTGKCLVKDLREMKSTLFNFTTSATGGHVKGLADIFKFSSKFNETYMGTAKVRGIEAHHWTTCLHIEALKATFNVDYYFSKKSYDVSGNLKEVPLRMTIKGIASNVDQNNNVLNGTHDFDHVYDFIAFTPGPIQDTSVFQIPPGIVCTGSKLSKPIPSIAQQLSFGLEQMNQEPGHTYMVPVYMQVDYDFSSKLARMDLSQVPTGGLRKAFGNDSISLIQDFNIGVQYVIDAMYGNCSVTELTASFNDFTPRPNYLLPPEMRHPIAMLEVNFTHMIYQGQKIYRGFSVESWGKIDDVTKVVYEIFFRKHGEADSSLMEPVGIYVSMDEMNNQQTSSQLKVESYTNIYNYLPDSIDPARFDIRDCYPTESPFKQLQISISTDNPQEILTKKSLYLNHIHQFLSRKAHVQPTRISDLYISPGIIAKSVSVHFTLLEKSPMPPGRYSNTDLSPTLQEAYDNLQMAVQSGSVIKVQNLDFPVVRTSLYTQEPVQSKSKSEQGYSGGSMAGLGIGMLATGIVCGIVGAYMVHRQRDLSVPYELQ